MQPATQTLFNSLGDIRHQVEKLAEAVCSKEEHLFYQVLGGSIDLAYTRLDRLLNTGTFKKERDISDPEPEVMQLELTNRQLRAIMDGIAKHGRNLSVVHLSDDGQSFKALLKISEEGDGSYRCIYESESTQSF